MKSLLVVSASQLGFVGEQREGRTFSRGRIHRVNAGLRGARLIRRLRVLAHFAVYRFVFGNNGNFLRIVAPAVGKLQKLSQKIVVIFEKRGELSMTRQVVPKFSGGGTGYGSTVDKSKFGFILFQFESKRGQRAGEGRAENKQRERSLGRVICAGSANFRDDS